MKGKTIIELTDVNDGSVEKFEDDNMVTDALGMILRGVAGLSVTLQDGSEYYKTLLGGLMLFDGKIDEKASTVYAPQGVNSIGGAAWNYGNPTENTALGTYNGDESGPTEDGKGFKFVYDFSTSQANGKIACACLTSADGGVAGYGQNAKIVTSTGKNPFFNRPMAFSDYKGLPRLSKRSMSEEGNLVDMYFAAFRGVDYGKDEILFAFDSVEDIAYYLRIESTTSVTVVKRRADMRYPSMVCGRYEHRIVDETTASLSTALPSKSTYIGMNFDTIRKELWLFHGTNTASTVAPNKTLPITIVGIDGSVRQYNMRNCTTKTCYVSSQSNATKRAVGCDGWLYLTDASSNDIYRMEPELPSEVVKLTWQGGESYEASKIVMGNRLHLVNKNGIVDPSGTIVKDVGATDYYPYVYGTPGGNLYAFFVPDVNGIVGLMMSWYGYNPVRDKACPVYANNYLATINNLSSPVTKTADKTMKVTYIITEE